MEQDLNSFFLERFNLPKQDIRTYSSLSLAYIGDCIFDLVIRSILVNEGHIKAADLHQKASKVVNATSQSNMIESILDELSEEEMAVYMRGRNAKSHTTAKNASVIDYRKATGFEALVGYLYLNDKMDRVCDLIELALERTGVEL